MFKVGDKVRITKKVGGSCPPVGTEGEVTCIHEHGLIRVQHGETDTGLFYSHELELVKEEPTPQELAAEWRETFAQQRETRAKLEAMGYTLMKGYIAIGAMNKTPVEEYKFVKTTTIRETL